MAQVKAMIQSHPHPMTPNGETLVSCIEACMDCAQACTACADACLAEDGVADLRHCIRTDLDCADMCVATGAILSRQTEPSRPLLRAQIDALATACRECAAECDRHASMHDHCRICADVCRRCEQTCRHLLENVPAAAA